MSDAETVTASRGLRWTSWNPMMLTPMDNPTPARTQTALYWLAWSLKECDGMPLEMIAKRLGKSSTEILEILLTHPGRSHAPQMPSTGSPRS